MRKIFTCSFATYYNGRRSGCQVEIIFNKSQKNLKAVYDRFQRYEQIRRGLGKEKVFFLAIGGYNRTMDLLRGMNLKNEDISVQSNLYLSQDFLKQTHNKKCVVLRDFNYITSSYSDNKQRWKMLDLKVAEAFEKELLIYDAANRYINPGTKNQAVWIKPTVVILDDPSFNLQFNDYRFNYGVRVGFAQPRGKNVNPYDIIAEIQNVEPTDHMMFAIYKHQELEEEEIINALNNLRINAHRKGGGGWLFKPTEFKRICGSNELANGLRKLPELNITQLKSNQRYGKENARWITVPDEAFDFNGFTYLDEEEEYELQLQEEEMAEQEFIDRQERILDELLSTQIHLNVKKGYVGADMAYNGLTTLDEFLNTVDTLNSAENTLSLLEGASTEEEYDHLKAHNMIYFLDGRYKDNQRRDGNYEGGRKLITIDIDSGSYTRDQIESALESSGYFGIVYPTPRYYFDGSERWRLLMLADGEMDKDTYKATVEGVIDLLGIDHDPASSKLSQLMGYPIKNSDISIVIGSKVSAKQYRKPISISAYKHNITNIKPSKKSLIDFNHEQARAIKEALEYGVSVGDRNNQYYGMIRYLRDTLNNPEFAQWHKEAIELEEKLRDCMRGDGLSEREVELICR